jgi:ABC-2 type transport system permease protein
MKRLTWITDLFPNAYYVARREYLIRTRSRTFAVLTVAIALVGLALTLLPLGVRLIGGDKPSRIAVYSTLTDLSVDPATTLQASLNASSASDQSSSGSSGPRYVLVPTSDPAPAKDEVRSDKLDGLLSLSRATDGDISFDYFSKDSPTSQRLALVRQAAGSLAVADRLQRAGVPAADRGRIFAPTAFVSTPADPVAARRNQDQFVPSYILATVFVILMFMAIQVYGNWVAASVAEEKNSRVMELLISAATPRQLLFGKVLGNGAAGLTQYLVVLIAAAVGYLVQGRLSNALLGGAGAATIPGVTPFVLGWFGVFFVTGFIEYTILYAAAGSMVSRQEDVQQIAGPLTFLGLGGYLLSFLAISSIDAGWVRILSFVPFISPFFFPARIVLSDPVPWEYALSLALTLVGILGGLWVAARIYAAGVLLYGQRPTIRAMWRATVEQR